MAVISKTNYETLADLIGNAFAEQKSAKAYITSGLNVVLGLDDADQEYDMIDDFYITNNSADTTFSSPNNFISVARSLQQHVQSRSGDTVQQFLTDNSITVSSEFAEVSKAAGFDIDDYIV